MNYDTMTYEELCEAARQASISQGFAAVVQITHYMQSRSITTVAAGRTPITTHQRGPEFRGVLCQFRNGQPYGAAPKPQPLPMISDTDPNELPF